MSLSWNCFSTDELIHFVDILVNEQVPALPRVLLGIRGRILLSYRHHLQVSYPFIADFRVASNFSSKILKPATSPPLSAVNTCRTCSGFSDSGGECVPLDYFPVSLASSSFFRFPSPPSPRFRSFTSTDWPPPPSAFQNATVEEYGEIGGTGAERVHNIKADSWGEYWGDMGFAKIVLGKNMMGIEDNVAWVTPGTYTTENVACSEDGKICGGEIQNPDLPTVRKFVSQTYVDPSVEILAAKAKSSLRVQK